jgi:hypothetical protein
MLDTTGWSVASFLLHDCPCSLAAGASIGIGPWAVVQLIGNSLISSMYEAAHLGFRKAYSRFADTLLGILQEPR